LKHNIEIMEYNSSRPHLVIPEYGRNVQKMIDYALTVEDREERSNIAPYPIPSAETMYRKPDRIPYPSNQIRFKHYGKTVEVMIEKAMQMEEGELKDVFVCTVANFMKMAYVNWNRDSVSDELILEQLKILSGSALTLKENYRLNHQPLEFNKKVIKPSMKPSMNRNPGMNKLNILRKNKKK
jgi:hypothetical protein